MKCPRCDADNDKVIDSRAAFDGAAIRRRRECLACGHRYSTFEEILPDDVRVVKRDGTREKFSHAKLERGIRKACVKRPVADEQISALVSSVVRALGGDGEVTSERLGEMVMERLLPLDEVACVRFASVYRSFSDIDQFTSAIAEMAKNGKPPADKAGMEKDEQDNG